MILGITGFIAAGKTELTNIVSTYGFTQLSFGDVVREEAKKQGLSFDRSTLQELGNSFREKHGGDIWARRIYAAIDPSKNYVIEGIRNPEEVSFFQTTPSFVLLAIDASTTTRYERLCLRKREGDPLSLKDFIKADFKDKGVLENSKGQQSLECFLLASKRIVNEGSREDLEKSMYSFLKDSRLI